MEQNLKTTKKYATYNLSPNKNKTVASNFYLKWHKQFYWSCKDIHDLTNS